MSEPPGRPDLFGFALFCMYAMLCSHRSLLHFGKALENSLAVPEKVLERDPETRIRGDVISLGRNPRRGRKPEQAKTNRGSVPPQGQGTRGLSFSPGLPWNIRPLPVIRTG